MPRLLDLFCGAGGCSSGYEKAGFEVVGVDISPQPNYPFKFVRAEALNILQRPHHYHAGWLQFDAIHASPPCQAFTAYRNNKQVGNYPDLVSSTRGLLDATGLPYVIENVVGAPVREDLLLCGTMFDPPMEIQRHRIFETNWDIQPPMWPCRHKLNGQDRYPGGRSVARTGVSTGLVRATIEIGSWDIPLAKQQEAMDIDWMTLEELSEAIPPCYTQFIGDQLLAHLQQPYAPIEST